MQSFLDFLTSTEAPWWGVPVIAGGFLIIGAIIAFISTRSSDMRKAKREEARRWDAEIRDHGATFLEASDRDLENMREFQKLRKQAHYVSVTDPTDGKVKRDVDVAQAAQKGARKELSKAMHQLSFIAPDSVMMKVRRHYINILSLQVYETANTQEARSKLANSRREVVDSIRNAIGLKSSKLGVKPWYKRLWSWFFKS